MIKDSKIILYLIIVLSLVLSTNSSYTVDNQPYSLLTKNKFFLKTYYELPVSEATGEISIRTGITSFDNLNSLYKVKQIKRVFEQFNGDAEVYRELEMSRIYVFYLENEISDIQSLVNSYFKEQIVEYAEPNFVGTSAGVNEGFIPSDPYFSKQWYLKNNGTTRPSNGNTPKIGADINMEKAWDVELGDENVIIAILDSGIEDESQDLKGRLWVNKKEIPNNGIDDDRNGYVDDYNGWDFAYEDYTVGDGFGHGTNIASVIGARLNNNFGFSGINLRSKLMNCKNLSDNNTGEYEWWAKSIKYAVDNGARIINMSEGGEDYSRVLKTAVEYANVKGCLIVAAMMNKANGKNYYPAAYDGIFAVGATDTDDSRCERFSWGGGSCWGKHISVVAPGNKIYGVDYENPYSFSSFWSGTSQATAIVSGIASLILSQDINRNADDIKKIIISTAIDEVGDPVEDKKGWDKYYGWGRVDCYLALTYDKNKIREKKEEKNEVVTGKENSEENDEQAKAIKDRDSSKKQQENNNKDKPARKK